MPPHCNKDNKTGLLKEFYNISLLLFVLSLVVPTALQAKASTVPVGLTFSTTNYTQCDSLLIQIQVSTDKAFSNIVDQSNWTVCKPNTDFTYSASLPALQGIFYWRGRHMNPCTGEITAWSSFYKFYLLLDTSKLVAGDVNGDGFLNLMDLIYLVEYFFQGGLPPTPSQSGDVSCDGKCTVGDLIYLINYLFKFGPPPCRPSLKPLSLEHSSFSGQQMAK
jgi:hypothetical protein